jgi:hypothetical protein
VDPFVRQRGTLRIAHDQGLTTRPPFSLT